MLLQDQPLVLGSHLLKSDHIFRYPGNENRFEKEVELVPKNQVRCFESEWMGRYGGQCVVCGTANLGSEMVQ